MKLPFSAEQFFSVFREYNESVWPLQNILLGSTIIIIALVILRHKWSGMFSGILLTALWLWMGIGYHLLFFSAINPMAKIFGVLFIVQGLLFGYSILIAKNINLVFEPGVKTGIGALFILFALLIYPLLSVMLNHLYPANPTFGLPCPTTIFTFGILLWSEKRIPFYVVIIPLLWSVIGFTASFTMDVKEDTGLLVAGIIFAGFQFRIFDRKN